MILIENRKLDPYFNLAADEYLTKESKESIITLWRNDNTIVIGKNQNTTQEINESFVREKNINVARRITGGGAVYHDLGNLNFSFITPANGQKVCDFKRFLDPIRQALSGLGISAEFSGKNDLLIDGKKFSGNAQLIQRDRVLHHGTLLFSSDVKIIAECLNPDKKKLAKHGVASVKSRVTTIAENIEGNITFDEFYNHLRSELVKFFGIEEIRGLNAKESDDIQLLSDTKHRTKEWIYGASPIFNYSKTNYFPGCGSVTFYLEIGDDIIQNVMILGDFIGARDVSELEAFLIGKHRDEIHQIVSDADVESFFLGIDRVELVDWLCE